MKLISVLVFASMFLLSACGNSGGGGTNGPEWDEMEWDKDSWN